MDGYYAYAPQAYYGVYPPTNGAPHPHYQYMAMNAGGAAPVSANGAPTRRTVVMTKLPGERSFGMTLEQHVNVAPTEYPRVSCVFQNSAAYRAGIQSGWAIEFINGAPSVGRTVSEVASIFRNLTQVTLFVDTSLEAPAPAVMPLPRFAPPAPPAPVPQPYVPPLQQPQAQFPIGATSFAALVPPNMLGMSGGLASSAMNPVVTSTMATMVPAAYSNAPPSTTAAANGARAPTQAVPTPVATSALASQPVPVSIQATVVAPARQSAPVSHVPVPAASRSAAITTATTVSATTAPPATSAGAQPQAQAQAPAVPPTSTAPATHVATPAPMAPSPSTAVTPTPVPPPVPRHQQAPRPVTSAAPALPVRIAHQSAFTLPATAPPSAATTTATATPTPISNPPASSSASSSPSTSAAAAPATATESQTVTGRRRRRSTAAESASDAPAATGRRRGRQARRRASTVSDVWDSEDAAYFYASSDDVEVVESPEPSTANGSRRSARQSESGGRNRRSMTVSRLMKMGFEEEDALASVEACGQDPDRCMVWIVSHLEEKQFLNDLNKASIESEQQKRLDAQEQKKQESETLRQATAFASLFPSSYILSSSAEATRLHEMLASTIGEIAADTHVRTLMSKLLTVESKAIRWYKEASKCYMLQLAGRLETAYMAHDVVTCCAQTMTPEPASNGCAFVRALHEEEEALTKALFSMPENHGGVPLEFLRADESMQFSLDDDGFEVMEQAPKAGSP